MLAQATLRFRLALAVLLAAIGLQAVPAHALPIRAEHGSAFSASTEEVSLGARRTGVGEVRFAAVPLPAARPVMTAEPVNAPSAIEPWPAIFATGPPLRPIPLVRGPAPRAPPPLN